MSLCANIVVLFRQQVSAARVREVEDAIANRVGSAPPGGLEPYGRLVAVDDADLHASVLVDGSLSWEERARSGPLMGEPSMQGRLYRISYLTRFWSPSYSEGPLLEYVATLLTVLALPDVEGLWFVSDHFFDGAAASPVTEASAHQMLDTYVRIGATFDGEAARYIRAEDGSSIRA